MLALVENNVNAASNEELQTIAREVFKETPEKMAEDIEEMREFIKSTPHLKNVRKDDFFLQMFLRGCNYNLALSKEKLDMYFTVRSLLPAWFDNWNPEQEQLNNIFSAGIYLPLRGFDKQGRYVILIRSGQVIPGSMTVDDCYKAFIMLFAMVLEGNVQASTKGLVMLLDEEGLTTSHAYLMSPSTLRKLMLVFQEAYPMDNDELIEMSLLYFLNMPKLLRKFFSLFLTFLNEKYKKMLKTHESGGFDDLKDVVGEDILPVEYGGKNSSVAELTKFWKDEVAKHSEWLAHQTTIKTDESLRVGKSKIQTQLSCSIM